MTRQASEIRLEASGLSLAARLWQGEGTPILALHGWLDNAASFDELARNLPDRTLCALDLAGHGWSDHRPAAAAYHYVDNVADVLAAANSLGWDRFHLLGHSLGGGISTLLAAAVPERIGRAVLIEALGPMSTPAEEAHDVLRRALHDRLAPRTAGRRCYASLDEAAKARQSGPLAIGLEAAQALTERGTVAVPEGLEWRADPRLRWTSAIRLSEELALAFIAAMRVPTCLLHGDRMPPSVAEMYRRRVAVHPDLRVESLQGGHHLHMEEAAPIVAARVAAFLAAD